MRLKRIECLWKFMVNLHRRINLAENGFDDFKVVILVLKTKSVRLLKPGQTITGDFYRQQLIRLKRAIAEKRPECATRHESIIFHHDNARPHVAVPVKNYLENSGWEVLAHPPYSPDLAPSDYHLFRSMQNALTGIRFTSEQGIKNWLDSFLASKDERFFHDGIHKLPERWEKVVASDGQYFD